MPEQSLAMAYSHVAVGPVAYDPAPHCVHTEFVPDTVLYVPCAHGKHVCDTSSRYSPSTHVCCARTRRDIARVAMSQSHAIAKGRVRLRFRTRAPTRMAPRGRHRDAQRRRVRVKPRVRGALAPGAAHGGGVCDVGWCHARKGDELFV